MSLDLLLAFLGGVCPALVWLFFWLMEDACEPEPKRYIIYSFLLGMVAVAPALFFERLAQESIPSGVFLLLAWAATEEVVKYGAAYLGALRLAAFDEPLDAVVYLATAALGFSALENALFLWTPLSQGDLIRGIVTEDLRFMGASLLHVVASVTIGLALALSFYKPRGARIRWALGGLILAVALHTVFNFFIIEKSTEMLWVFVCLWVGTIAMLLMVERVKEPKDYC